jgi:NADH:ubiquinone oxidoreductase subunit 3 (subunit A)
MTYSRKYSTNSLQPYEIGGSALADVKQVGDVVFYAGELLCIVSEVERVLTPAYKEHSKGGHFPALDVPEYFVEDIRKCFAELV